MEKLWKGMKDTTLVAILQQNKGEFKRQISEKITPQYSYRSPPLILPILMNDIDFLEVILLSSLM